MPVVVVVAEVDEPCLGGCSPVSSGATWILGNGAPNQRTILPQPLGGGKNVPKSGGERNHRGNHVEPWSRDHHDEDHNRACGATDPEEHQDGSREKPAGNDSN